MWLNYLRKEIMEALAKHGFNGEVVSSSRTSNRSPKASPSKASGGQRQTIALPPLADCPPIRYRIRDGSLFVHRKSAFEAVGLERVVMTQGRGFGPINHILSRAGKQFNSIKINWAIIWTIF